MQNILNVLFRDAPTRVQVALGILWTAILLNCLHAAFAKQATFPQMPASIFASVAILLIVYNVGRAILYLKIADGKVWARNIFLGLAVVSLLSLTSVSIITQAQGMLAGLLTILLIAVDGVAASLLMQAPTAFWKQKG